MSGFILSAETAPAAPADLAGPACPAGPVSPVVVRTATVMSHG